MPTILNRDVFQTDPTQSDIPNDGVAKVGQPETEQQWRVLEHELRTFVCKGEYERGIDRVLNSYLTHLDRDAQPAGWISGFYGSGKSHLVRVLEHLWRDTEFPNGNTARNMTQLPSEIRAHLVNLTTIGRQRGGLWSAAGTLSSSGDVGVRLAILAVILRSAGLPEAWAQAQLVLRLQQEGVWDAVVDNLTAQGREVERELRHMYNSRSLFSAIRSAYPDFGSDEDDVRDVIRMQYPRRTDVSNSELVATIGDVLDLVSDTPGKQPCALVILDELQQFIGDDPQIALEVQETVETCCTHFGSGVLFVSTGQAQLAARAQLQKLQGRFSINVHLQDVDIEEVIREVVLLKKESARDDITEVLEQTSGEIDRHLKGTPFGPRPEDMRHLVADYPLLPTRRRFWEAVLRAVDTGTTGQLRTQLRIVHNAAADIADRPLGTVIPGDRIYQHVRTGVLNSGALQVEISNTIDRLAAGDADDKLRARLCSTIFLIERVAAESGTPTGLRPTADILADLLIEDLRDGSQMFRQRVTTLLEPLVQDGTLQRVNDEYHLQTAESAEWERDFRARETRIRNDDIRVTEDRRTALRTAVNTVLTPVKNSLRQGETKEKRELLIHTSDDPPPAGNGVPVWVPVSWALTENQLTAQAAAAGTNSPVVFVHLPRRGADALRDALAEVAAAEETLGSRGTPSTDEGLQARASMMSRLDSARNKLNGLVAEVLAAARVFQAGGNEVADGNGLAANIQIAGERALSRLYPEFRHADHAGWATAVRRASDGRQDALEAVGHRQPTLQHPVCREISTFIGGGGKRGNEVRQHFAAPPFGWSQDAIDGALLAMLAVEQLTARYEGKDVGPKDLTRSNISRAEFRVPDVEEIPTALERITATGFVRTILGSTPQPDQLSEQAGRALDVLAQLATEASGEPPLPARDDTTMIDELRGQVGNRRIKGVAARQPELEAAYKQWTARKQAIAARKPRWDLLDRLLTQAGKLPAADDVRVQMQAIRDQRSLLAEPDPARPLVDQLSKSLRERLQSLHAEVDEALHESVRELTRMPEWGELNEGMKNVVLEKAYLVGKQAPDVSTDEKLLQALSVTPLSTLENERDAMRQRAERAREDVILAVKPKAVRVKLPGATLSTPEEIDDWLVEVGKLLKSQMTADGTTRPVIV